MGRSSQLTEYKSKAVTHTLGADREANLEPIHPLGLGHATAESRLTGEQALPARPDADDRRDERRVDHPVDLRAVGERDGQVPLQGSQFWFEGACAALLWLWPTRLGKYGRRCAWANLWKSLAAESWPLGEDGESQDFSFRWCRWTS